MRPLRDFGLVAFAGIASLFGVAASLGLIGEIWRHNWFLAFTAPLYVLGAYWLVAVLAAPCGLAFGAAFGWQWITAG